MILIDSNVCIAVMNGSDAQLSARYDVVRETGRTIALSTIVMFELEFGVANSRRKSNNRLALDKFLSDAFKIVSFEADDVRTAARVRAHLKSLGTPIGPYDLLIAAQTLRLGATLVTANTREFARVPDLALEDWAGDI